MATGDPGGVVLAGDRNGAGKAGVDTSHRSRKITTTRTGMPCLELAPLRRCSRDAKRKVVSPFRVTTTKTSHPSVNLGQKQDLGPISASCSFWGWRT